MSPKRPDCTDRLLELTGDLWDFHAKGEWIAITTNGSVNAYGNAVMGRGVAQEAKIRYSWLPKLLAIRIKEEGNIPILFGCAPHEERPDTRSQRIVTFPVKHEWHQKANLELIRKSAECLITALHLGDIRVLYTVRPGCGNGHRKWETEVRPILLDVWAGHLDRFVIVERKVS